MKEKLSTFGELSKKSKIPEEAVVLMFAYEGLLKNSKFSKSMKKVDFELDLDSISEINKICKVLKISKSAVMNGLLHITLCEANKLLTLKSSEPSSNSN